ncbi:uncharacterized protein LOC121414911 [Lytechinus variegatus]|uniref:uncharacterized protein LOC121414911 n=1 Tax=Lytechinus variegatus TaxID=7654 RepID=UPI001BB1BC60|nr:uncharacterized protein LOC121414911 [Lytechinus variegatus]
MFARLFQKRILQLSTRLQSTNSKLLLLTQAQQTSPCTAILTSQPTCGYYLWQQSPHCQPQASGCNLPTYGFHSIVGTRYMQEDPLATSATEGSSGIPDPSLGGLSLEDTSTASAEEAVEDKEVLFEDESES